MRLRLSLGTAVLVALRSRPRIRRDPILCAPVGASASSRSFRDFRWRRVPKVIWGEEHGSMDMHMHRPPG
jgi:hypothetical protein